MPPVPQNSAVQDWDVLLKNYTLFMIPKPLAARLSISMEPTDNNWQAWPQPYSLAAFGTQDKELALKLSLETRNRGDVMVVHCQGRIVYRDEAAALSRLVGEILENGGKVVLDLSGVSSIDSAGIGELAFLYTWARSSPPKPAPTADSPRLKHTCPVWISDCHPEAGVLCPSKGAFGSLPLTLPLKSIPPGPLQRHRLGYFQKCPRRMGKSRFLAVDQAQLPLHPQFPHRNPHQLSPRQFRLHADLRHERDSISHSHELFDRLQRRQFKPHVQRRFVLFECLQNFLAVGRRNNMRDKRFCPELPDAHLPRRGQRMLWRHHEHQLIQVCHHRVQPRLLGLVRQHPKLRTVLQHIVRNAAAQRSLHRDLDHGMQPPELRQHRQQIKRRELIGRDHQLALLQLPQRSQRFMRVVPQIQQFFGVFIQHLPGVS